MKRVIDPMFDKLLPVRGINTEEEVQIPTFPMVSEGFCPFVIMLRYHNSIIKVLVLQKTTLIIMLVLVYLD